MKMFLDENNNVSLSSYTDSGEKFYRVSGKNKGEYFAIEYHSEEYCALAEIFDYYLIKRSQIIGE